MINKKNMLGKSPEELGAKDAIHVAIVSVRAARPIKPGQWCGLNKEREAIPDDKKGCGVADPFRTEIILTGQYFWLMMDQSEIPNVQHHWEHPKLDFSPPTNEVNLSAGLLDIANRLGVSYIQFMDACAYFVKNDKPAKYPGTLTADKFEDAWEDARCDLWSEWSDEVGHEFENFGSACCPEYAYPEGQLFDMSDFSE